MNTLGSARILALFFLPVLLVLLISPAALVQDDYSVGQSQSWQEKWASTDFVQEQFQANPFLFFLAIFAFGVAVSLTPCVLPMIPITLSIVSGSRQHVEGRSRLRTALSGLTSSIIYVLGVSITYALLGVAAVVVGFGVRSFLQDWIVQTLIGALFVVLGLAMVGVINLPIPGWGRTTLDKVSQRQQARRPLPTIFALGLVSGIIASPCVAPVSGALLTWIATTNRIWLGFWLMFVFGLGMGLLFVVMGLTGWILASGKWMLIVKAILGLLLVLMGLLVIVQGLRAQPLIPLSWLG